MIPEPAFHAPPPPFPVVPAPPVPPAVPLPLTPPTAVAFVGVFPPFAFTDPNEDAAVTAYRAAQRAREALDSGITTIRSVHEQNQVDLALRQANLAGWFNGPRIFGAGRAISTPEGHGKGSACSYAEGFEGFYKAAKEDLQSKPEGSLKFQLGKSLEDILYDWWSDVFVSDSDLDLETSISDLVDRIELFLPKSQSAEGSQSFDSELLVEGWNKCILIIKTKLRCSITERNLR